MPTVAASTTFSNSQVQTVQQKKKIKIILSNLQAYVQIEANSDVSAYVQLDQISLDNKTSRVKSKKSAAKKAEVAVNHELLIQFRKKKDDPILSDGMLDLIIEDLLMEVDVPTLNGIIDFIDDDGDESERIKPSLPANIQIQNSQFVLNKCVANQLDKFKNQITIESLCVKKCRLNEIVLNINQDMTSVRPRGGRSKVPRIKSFDKEMLIVDYESKVAEKDLIDKMTGSKADQLASLVFLLRKSKEVGIFI